jgi:hypothetical protein
MVAIARGLKNMYGIFIFCGGDGSRVYSCVTSGRSSRVRRHASLLLISKKDSENSLCSAISASAPDAQKMKKRRLVVYVASMWRNQRRRTSDMDASRKAAAMRAKPINRLLAHSVVSTGGVWLAALKQW